MSDSLILGSPWNDEDLSCAAVREDDGRIFVFIERRRVNGTGQRIGFRGDPAHLMEDPDRTDHYLKQLCDQAGLPAFSRKREEIRRGIREALNIPVE
jgi:hypothetical protein